MKINQVNLLILCDIRIATFSVSITNIVKHRLHVWSEYIFLLCWFIIYSPSSWQPAAVAMRDAGVRWEERGAVLKFWSLQCRDICRFCCKVSPRDVMLQVAAALLSVSQCRNIFGMRPEPQLDDESGTAGRTPAIVREVATRNFGP